MDAQIYLADDFDISKLTVPNLRSVLVEHEVPFPSNANKQELINIFNKHIKPRALQILKKYQTEPSSEEICEAVHEDKHGADSSKSEKSIPSKRHSEATSKKAKKKIRKTNTELLDSSSSFLGIEKFEPNENDDIFNNSIDTSTILRKTRFADKKPASTKDILSHFDKSIPSSKSFNDSVSSDSKTRSHSPVERKDELNIIEKVKESRREAENNIHNSQGNEFLLIEDVETEFGDDLVEEGELREEVPLTINFPGESEVNPHKILEGPIKSIKEVVSVNNNESLEKVKEEVLTEGNKLVSTIQVEPLGSPETNNSSSDKNLTTIDINEEASNKKNADSNQTTQSEWKDKHVVDEHGRGEEVEKLETIQTVGNTNNGYRTNRIPILLLILFYGITVVNLLIPTLLLLCFREIKLNTGYCGFDKPSKTLDLWGKLPDAYTSKLLNLKPYFVQVETLISDSVHFQCSECPPNSKCQFNTLQCDYGYVKTYPLKSVFGLIPLQETCEFDFLHEQKMHYLSKYTIKYLRRHHDQPLTLEELHDYIKSTKSSYISSSDFEEYWDKFVKYELFHDEQVTIDAQTNVVTLTHKVPSEFYTRTYGVDRKKRSKNLFKKHTPTVDFRDYYTKN